MSRADSEQERSAPIALDADAFRTAGHALVDQLANWLNELPHAPIVHDESVSEIRRVLQADRGLPEAGTDAQTLLHETAEMLFAHSLFNGHPRFFGYITSSPAPIGALGDLLASAINQNVGAWRLSPLATEIEAQTVRWIAELIGFPADAGGLLVSGGNMANIVGVLAARMAAMPEIRTGGARTLSRQPRVYASTEAHTWLHKAADISGLGTDAIRWIPVDANQRMDVAALDAQIASDRAAGELPFLVVATAGTVSTGAVDPLPEIASVCQRHQLWFHVDGAYGAFAARVPGAPVDLLGLTGADSIAVDPHKWLYAPLEAGCILVRQGSDLLKAFSYNPAYYHFDSEVTNYFEYGPQNSRGFRALKVWLALRQVGKAGYVRMIGDDMSLARRLHGHVQQHPDFEAMTQNLSITTFRSVPRDLRDRVGSPETERYLDSLNQDLLTRVERSGEAFLSNAVVDGRFALRACVVNFRTTAADIDALLPLLARIGSEVGLRR
jgi:glutamate/tyrosine decarboxylase-like PLP-dependent enzyme